MRVRHLHVLVLLAATLAGCAAKAQVQTEAELPLLDPPPPPPRVVAQYPEALPLEPAEPAEQPVPPARPPSRAPRTDPAPVPSVERREGPGPLPSPLSLTLTPAPGTEAQTAEAIRNLLARAARDLARVNVGRLNADGRAQFETARRFLQQADEALAARNVVFAGKLADKAATMAAMLSR